MSTNENQHVGCCLECGRILDEALLDGYHGFMGGTNLLEDVYFAVSKSKKGGWRVEIREVDESYLTQINTKKFIESAIKELEEEASEVWLTCPRCNGDVDPFENPSEWPESAKMVRR